MASKGYPTIQADAIPTEKIRNITGSLLELNAMGRCKTDEEVDQRIEQYFAFLETSCLRPSIETLCTALHISRTTLFRWKQGIDCSEHRQASIQNAIQIISSFLEQSMLSGMLNPASGIFMLKNWCGYKDTLSIEDVSAAVKEERKKYKSADELPDFRQFANHNTD